MIYRDVDLKKWSERHHLKIKEEICRAGCAEKMVPNAVETKLSWGINYECPKCDFFTYTARPKDTEFWDKII